MDKSRSFLWTAFALLLMALLRASAALAAAPGYEVVELGSGSPVDVNSSGTVIGLDGTATLPRPWIVRDGVKSYLPLPAGQSYAMVNRISESGVVVGHVSARPVMWLPANGSYLTLWLPLPAGTTGGLPIAVIDTFDGPEVLLNYGDPTFLSSPTAVYFSDSRSFLYNTIDGLVDLAAEYGLVSVSGAFFPAADMTPSGRILLSRGMILEPDGSVTPSPGKRTTSWTGFTAHRLNESGAILFTASLATSDGHAEIARYSPAGGWFVIETFIGATYPYSADGISDPGDSISSQYGGHMLTTADGQRLSLNALLLDPGYALTSAPGGAMSDDGRIVMVARNPAGVWGAVRLDPGAPFPPPDAVVLSGRAHPAIPSEPWDAISLSWTVSSGASAYIVERKGPGDADFVAVTPNGGTIQRIFDDTAIAPSTSYTYRVIPVGVAGNGASSNLLTVVSPSAMDSVPPVAAITAPADGAVVSGVVAVSAQASDNVGLRGLEILYQPNQGSEILCARSFATVEPAAVLSCEWDPRYLPSGTSAQLVAFAYDDLGNFTKSAITVTYRAATAPDTKAPVVSIQSPANNSTVAGVVAVRASATDNVGVVRMQILDGAGRILATAKAAEIAYAWNTAVYKRGSRQTLTVRAFDAAGKVGTAKISVRIGR